MDITYKQVKVINRCKDASHFLHSCLGLGLGLGLGSSFRFGFDSIDGDISWYYNLEFFFVRFMGEDFEILFKVMFQTYGIRLVKICQMTVLVFDQRNFLFYDARKNFFPTIFFYKNLINVFIRFLVFFSLNVSSCCINRPPVL